MGCGSVSKDTTKTKIENKNEPQQENDQTKMDKKEIVDILNQSLQQGSPNQQKNQKGYKIINEYKQKEKSKTVKFEIDFEETEDKEKKLKKFQQMQEKKKKQQEEQFLKKQQQLLEEKNSKNQEEQKQLEENLLPCQKFRMSPKKKVKSQTKDNKKQEEEINEILMQPSEKQQIKIDAEQENI